MGIFKKGIIFISLTILLCLSSSCQAITTGTSLKSGLKANQNNDKVSGNVTVILYNVEGYFTDNQISSFRNYIDNLNKSYTSSNFNFTIIDSTIHIGNDLDTIVTKNTPDYIIIIGPFDNTQLDPTVQTSLINKLNSWTHGTVYNSIKEIGLIDYMESNSDFGVNNFINSQQNKLSNSVTFANVNLLQAGFMSGVKAALLTKTDKIGLIIDHSLQTDFNDQLTSPNVNGTTIYSLNRVDFINGFVGGIEYASEYLLNKISIEIKTTDLVANSLTTDIKTLSDFHADVIFNMESALNDAFFQLTQGTDIQTGILGDNDTRSSFSFVEKDWQIIGDFLNMWNSSHIHFTNTYDLRNTTVLSLYPSNSQLSLVQTLLVNGTINPLSIIPIEGIPGFDISILFVPLLLVIIRKRNRR